MTTRKKTNQYTVGERVELHPGLDAWMRGDRFGVVVKLGTKYVHVMMDRSKRTLKVAPNYMDVIPA